MSGLRDRERFMRDHLWAPDRMSDYVDRDLSPGLRARMERHLGECDECRRLLEGLRRTVEALHGVSGLGEGVDASAIAASVRAQLR